MRYLILFLIWSFFIPSSILTAQNQSLKRYDIKSGIIQYNKTTDGGLLGTTIKGSGTQSLYFKDWGAIELIEEKFEESQASNIFGIKNEETSSNHTMNLMDNGQVSSVDFDRKKIMVRRDMAMDYMTRNNKDAGHVGKNMLESMGGEIIGTEPFLGFTCDVWDIPGGKQLMYKGVVLFMDIKLLGIRTVLEATSAKFDGVVSDKYFQLPDFEKIKSSDYGSIGDYEENSENDNLDIEKLSNMPYSEWKIIAKHDPEFKDKSDTELRKAYELIKSMSKMMLNNE